MVCSTIQALSDIVVDNMKLPQVCGQKNRAVHADFCAPCLRSSTEAVGRCDVSERACGCACKRTPFHKHTDASVKKDSFLTSEEQPKLER